MRSGFGGTSLPVDADDVRRYARLGRKRLSVGWRRAELSLTPSPQPLDADAAAAELSPDSNVLFLCLGNICRSPMAERYLRDRLRDLGVEEVSVESAGFTEREDRPSPEYAVEAAREHGVDLGDHLSTRVTEAMLAGSDLVFLMDAYNYALLKREFGSYADRAYFLNAFGDGDYEIPDPYGTDSGVFEDVYGDVAAAIDGFVERAVEDEQ